MVTHDATQHWSGLKLEDMGQRQQASIVAVTTLPTQPRIVNNCRIVVSTSLTGVARISGWGNLLDITRYERSNPFCTGNCTITIRFGPKALLKLLTLDTSASFFKYQPPFSSEPPPPRLGSFPSLEQLSKPSLRFVAAGNLYFV